MTVEREYRIAVCDTWGNAREGFFVNDVRYTGETVLLPEDASDRLINRRLGVSGIKWDGDPEYSLYGAVKRNECPVFQLHPMDIEED